MPVPYRRVILKLSGEALGVDGKSYVVTQGVKENVVKSARNLQKVKTAFSGVLSVYDIVNADTLIVDKAALETIGEVFGK